MDVCYSFGLVVQALYIISECVNSMKLYTIYAGPFGSEKLCQPTRLGACNHKIRTLICHS